MKKKRSFFIVTAIIIIIIVMSLITISTAFTFATAIGSTCVGVNTTVHKNDAANAYRNSGYTNVNELMDPSYIVLISNLAAEVQYFASHGNYDNIRFLNSGINLYTDYNMQTDDGVVELIGTNNINLWGNTLLVTYGACCTAGVGGEFRYDSLTYETAIKGAETVLGFKNDICQECFESWSKRYNNKLASGYGVLDAANYANTFLYSHDTVKQVQIVYNENANTKIGIYNSNSGLNSTSESRGKINIKNTKIESTDKNVINIVKQQNKISNIDDVEIKRNYTGVTNVLTGKTELIEYIDVKEKVGGYTTNSGFTIKCKDGIIEEIIDNTVEKAIMSEKNVKFDTKSDSEIELLKERAIKDVLIKYNNKVEIIEDEIDTEYFYDIENDKKYISVTVKTNAGTDGKNAYAIDCFKYEI